MKRGWQYFIDGAATITFTPDKGATAEVRENGVATTFALSLPTVFANTYLTETIITVDSTKQNVVWTPQADGTFTFDVTAEMLADLIDFAEFELDTKGEYDAFATALEGAEIKIAVSDGVSAT